MCTNLTGTLEIRNTTKKLLEVHQTLSLLEGEVWKQDYLDTVVTLASPTMS